MNKQEEKQWLRAILEGKVKPGDDAWRQVRESKDFEGIRESICKRAGLRIEEREQELDTMWQTIAQRLQPQQKAQERRRHRRTAVWVSWAAVVILLIGLPFLYSRKDNKEPMQVITSASISKQDIVLVMPDGERRALDGADKQVVADADGSMRTSDRTLIVEAGKEQEKAPQYYTLDVPKGAEYNLVLSDGTKIFLNAGTTLRYPDRFVGDTREISLSGEAYLEVAKDAEHPFIVKTDDIRIKVLGTTFNVNAYPDGEWVKTTLVQGKVETLCSNCSFIMEPGTQVAYNRSTLSADYKKVDVRLYTSWVDGYYDFEEMELGELMQIISRWYDVPIDFSEPELKKLKFSGRLQRYDSTEKLFEMLEYTQDVTYDITPRRITIRAR